MIKQKSGVIFKSVPETLPITIPKTFPLRNYIVKIYKTKNVTIGHSKSKKERKYEKENY